MATTILIKSNSTSGVAPRVDELSYAELALNTADGHLYTRTTSDEVVNLTSWDQLYNKPSAFTPSSHTHNITDITNLQSVLDTKQPTGDYVLDTDVRLSDAREPLSHDHSDDYKNVVVGKNSLSNLVGSDDNQRNTAIGTDSATNLSTGFGNTCLGSGSGFAIQNANFNTSVGGFALASNVSGVNNTAVGYGSLVANTTGNGNVSLGVNNLLVNTTGENNVAIGFNSLSSNTTGSYNISIGLWSGNDEPNLFNCIVLGTFARALNSGEFVIGSSAHPVVTSSTVGNGGSAESLPGTPLGYLQLRLNGSLVKIPYYGD